jgi:hypothetical protein
MSDWIPVSERLPEMRKARPGWTYLTSDTVLIATAWEDVCLGYRSQADENAPIVWWDAGSGDEGAGVTTVTHWMPLPKPPEVA